MKRPDAGTRESLKGVLLLIWIASTGLFFYLRFSIVFYSANHSALGRFIERLWP